jgi:UDP-N-acetylglucosamine--N-acetylmuramyl-(pentapeptide) pyrophosphoryl-undecaprenol N-acetylglucosamine transferase
LFGVEVDVPAQPVLMAGSPGGHLDVLERLRPAIADRKVVWATAEGGRARTLRARGEAVEELPLYGRSPLRLTANATRAARVLRRVRPALVVCSGAGLVVPLCLIARSSGVRIVFAETMARVTGPSLSGRVLSRLASSVLVQWPEMTCVYPGSRLCQPALLDDIGSGDSPGEGTFVAVGTHAQPFDRLLEAVDRSVEAGCLPRPVVAQSGPSSYRPRTYSTSAWMAPDELDAAAAAARYVVCHAGSGIVATALRAGRRPLVMARLRAHGEHVDDHQRQLAAKLGELGLAVPLEDAIGDAERRAADAPLELARSEELRPHMGAVLRAEVDRLADAPPVARGPVARARGAAP